MENETRNRPSMTKGWKIFLIAAAAVFFAATVVFASLFGVYYGKHDRWRGSAENAYRQSYYTLKDSVLNMEVNLSKLRVARTPAIQQELLVRAATEAQAGAAALAAMATAEQDFEPLVRYQRQIGDYCLACDRKLSLGNELSEEDYATLRAMYTHVLDLGRKLAEAGEAMERAERIVEDFGKIGSALSDCLGSYCDGTFEYPSLIYDGPFSDALTERVPKALSGTPIDINDARGYLVLALQGYELGSFEYLSVNDSYFKSHLYTFTTAEGLSGVMQIADLGGMPVMWDIETEVTNPIYSQEEGTEIASQYVAKLGIGEMKAVWSCVTDSVVYVNLCAVQDGVILYPDMVKVKVSLETGKVVGYEGLNYIYNHTARTLPQATIGETEAIANRYGDFTPESARLTLIPVDGGKEKLAYELAGMLDGYRFFVYVDAETGDQLRILEVIDSDEGALLM